MVAINASDILSSYFQGADFVARGMQRAEERQKQEKLDQVRELAGQANALFIPKRDSNGRLINASPEAIANSPEFIKLANHPLLRDVRMQGVNDPAVRDATYVGAKADPNNPHNVIPVLQHIDENGIPLASPGPLTQDRSRNSDAPIGSLSLGDLYNHVAGMAYSADPKLGQQMMADAYSRGLQELRTEYRNAATLQDKEAILRTAAPYGIAPEDIAHHSGADRIHQHPNGLVETTDAGGNVTLGYNPDIQKNVQHPATLATAQTEDAAKNAVLPSELDRRARTQWQDARISNDVANTYVGDANARLGLTATAQHQTNQNLTQADNQSIENSVKGLDSADPAVKAQSQQELLKYFKSPEDARTYVRGSQAETKLRDLRTAVLSGTSDDAYRNVAKELPYANKDTQLRVFTELAPLANDPDPKVRENAQAGLRAAVSVMKGPQQGKAPDPGEFNSSMANSYMRSLGYKTDTPEYQGAQAGATEAFNRLRKVLPNEITKGSQAETYATIAAVKAHDLAQQGMPNAEKPMFIHSELEDLGYPVRRMGTTKEFVKEIYNPLGDALTKAGIPEANDPTARRYGTELVVGLKSNGVSTGVAINEVAKLFQHPQTYWNKLQVSGGDLRSLASGLAKEIKERPSALGQALDKTGRAIDAANME
jgi:hypothetical protein